MEDNIIADGRSKRRRCCGQSLPHNKDSNFSVTRSFDGVEELKNHRNSDDIETTCSDDRTGVSSDSTYVYPYANLFESSAYRFQHSTDWQDDDIERRQRIEKAFQDCMRQPGVAKICHRKRRYFTSSGVSDSAYESLDSDAEHAHLRHPYDNKNQIVSIPSSTQLYPVPSNIMIGTGHPKLTEPVDYVPESSPTGIYDDVISLDSTHSLTSTSTSTSSEAHVPIKIVSNVSLNHPPNPHLWSERQSDDQVPSHHRLPRGFREVPGPITGVNWIVRNIHHLRPRRTKSCVICNALTHHSRSCPTLRCFCCGGLSHTIHQCRNSNLVCRLCGFLGHDDENQCPTFQVKNSLSQKTEKSLICCIKCGQRGHFSCASEWSDLEKKVHFCCHCGLDGHTFEMCRKRREFRMLEKYKEEAKFRNQMNQKYKEEEKFRNQMNQKKQFNNLQGPKTKNDANKKTVLKFIINKKKQMPNEKKIKKKTAVEPPANLENLTRLEKKKLKKEDRKAQKASIRRKKKH